jgi:AbrB family looped-hinge helix DNA binding protein
VLAAGGLSTGFASDPPRKVVRKQLERSGDVVDAEAGEELAGELLVGFEFTNVSLYESHVRFVHRRRRYYIQQIATAGRAMTSTMTSKGRVTIPKRVRDYLGLEPGAEVQFELRSNGEVVMRRGGRPSCEGSEATRFAKLRGTLKTGMTTDEIMRLLRGYNEDANDPGLR